MNECQLGMEYAYELELEPGLVFRTDDVEVAAAFLKDGYTGLLDCLAKKGIDNVVRS